MQIAIGLVIIVVMVYLMIKQRDAKTLLFAAGMLMLWTTGDFFGAFKSFSASMKQANIFEVIISSMGFAAVVKLTGADKHLVSILVKILKKAGPFSIIGVALATMLVNMSITSAAGCTAAIGTVLIPILIDSGIPAPLAAGAVLCGLYGGNLNPGHVHPTIVANLAGSTGVEFVKTVWPALITSVIVSSGILTALAFYLKKKQDRNELTDKAAMSEDVPLIEHPNFLYALLPLVPIIILMVGNSGYAPVLKMPVSHAMLIGAILCFIVTRTSPEKCTKEFFKAAGNAFGNVFGLIVCVNIFVAGLKGIGLLKILIAFMTTSPSIAKLAAVFGPFLLAILSGSGESASIAFNEAVSVHAEEFGMTIMNMGAMTVLSGGIGRSMSIFAAAMILAASLAKVTPQEVVKYNAIAMFGALMTAAAFLMF